MRDSHEGMPEILGVIEEDGRGFAVIELEKEKRRQRYRFGVTQEGFSALKSLLQLRPFDQMPGVAYRFFFVIGIRSKASGKSGMTIRVELDRIGKQLDMEAPLELIANLEWFRQLTDWNSAEHLAMTGVPEKD